MKMYLGEIVSFLCPTLEVSSWSLKSQGAAAIATLADKAGNVGLFVCLYGKWASVVCLYESQNIKKETKIPRVTDEGWNSQKQLSGPVEKTKEKSSCIFMIIHSSY